MRDVDLDDLVLEIEMVEVVVPFVIVQSGEGRLLYKVQKAVTQCSHLEPYKARRRKMLRAERL